MNRGHASSHHGLLSTANHCVSSCRALQQKQPGTAPVLEALEAISRALSESQPLSKSGVDLDATYGVVVDLLCTASDGDARELIPIRQMLDEMISQHDEMAHCVTVVRS